MTEAGAGDDGGGRGLRGREPDAQLPLEFRDIDEIEHVSDEIERDVSALAIQGRSLFCAADETSTVERLLYDPQEKRFGEHRSFALGELFDLPAGPDGEMDIEGIEIADGYLWITGSHSLKRDEPEEGAEDLTGLLDVEMDPNRNFLGRVPLADRGDGVFELAAEADGGREAACMKMRSKDGRTLLRKKLAKDQLLAPFVDLPCKENGLDIEGLAASGDRAWLGLRGPVVGKQALLIELRFKRTKKGWLKPRRLDDDKRYKLLAASLDGLGIRDLLIVENTLFFLAGATTDIEARQGIFAVDLPAEDAPAVLPEPRHLFDLGVRRGADHAEGLAMADGLGGKRRLAVVYDAPAEERIDPERDRLLLDLFDLPGG